MKNREMSLAIIMIDKSIFDTSGTNSLRTLIRYFNNISLRVLRESHKLWACSLVGAGTGLGWLMLIFYEKKILLTG